MAKNSATIPFAPKKRKASPSKPSPDSRADKPYWSGMISFGLVNVPIQLHAGVREKTVRFHLLHEKDSVRLRQKLVCPEDNEEVPREETVRGFEIDENKNVVLTPEEIRSLQPKADKVLELTTFAELKQIDPIYFDRTFYVLPKEGGAKGYHLLVAALQQTQRVGIGKIIMKNKEYLAALRSTGEVLFVETMHFHDEVVLAKEFLNEIPKVKANDVEIKMAMQLVDSLTSEFEPEKMHDDYREALMKLINQKARGGHVKVEEPEDDKGPEVIDLMAALQKSLTSSKKAKSMKVA